MPMDEINCEPPKQDELTADAHKLQALPAINPATNTPADLVAFAHAALFSQHSPL
jgi:hypothetical protein